MAKRKKLPLLENLEIIDIAAEGKAIGKYDNMVVFVPWLVPGDVADVQIIRKRKKYMEGVVIRVQSYSNRRAKPFCEHFGICGGCKWQTLHYEDQLKYKQKQVVDNLTRIGKTKLENTQPIIGSKKQIHYRNKLEYTFSASRWLTDDEVRTENEIIDRNALGFHVPGKFDRVLDLRNCYLQDNFSNTIRLAVKEFAMNKGFTFYHQRTNEGFLRNLIVRNTNTNEWMVIVVFGEEKTDEINSMLNFIKDTFPDIDSLMYVVNTKVNDSIADLEVSLFSGKDYISEIMEGLKFKIGPKSFFQTNSEQALELYNLTRKYAGLKGDEIVYDLYTGTGTIANFVAKQSKKVIGIEYIEEAIADAKVNSKINGIENTRFYAGDMKNILTTEFIKDNGNPDVIITDPPRAGMHPDVIKVIISANPEKIIYVSCNPATQARDIELLSEKYVVTDTQPVDMFPQTHHVENVIKLIRKGGGR